MTVTVSQLIELYKSDPKSRFNRLNHRVRADRLRYLSRIERDCGYWPLEKIKPRTLKMWYERWTAGGKISVGNAMFAQLRNLCAQALRSFDDDESYRLIRISDAFNLKQTKPRLVQMTAGQATAIRKMAHEIGYHSIALAQAFQYELVIRQQDVIGNWTTEPGSKLTKGVERRGRIWTGGLRWEEIDERCTLRHPTTARERWIEADLMRTPMVLEELNWLLKFRPDESGKKTSTGLPAQGPIIIYEGTGAPWSSPEFRRKWRMIAQAAGVPSSVRNMDSCAGARISRIAGRDFRDFERLRPSQQSAVRAAPSLGRVHSSGTHDTR